jgi:hypothetical protein
MIYHYQLLEGSPTTNLIRITTHIDQHISIKVKLDSGSYGDTYTYIDRTFDVDAWKRCGRTVRKMFLHNLEFVRHDANNREVAAERCVDAFFAEVKHSTVIVDAAIDLTIGVSMDDLIGFIQNNGALKNLRLSSQELVSLEQWTAISRVIACAQLKNFDIQYCNFEIDGSLERMLEGCARVDIFGCHASATHSVLQ